MTTPLRAFGPLEPTYDGWRKAAAALGRPAVALAARGPDEMPVTMSNHSHEENWFELLTRPLWGLAPAKDAVPQAVWDDLARTVALALDPGGDWYIGDPGPRSQRCVESAALGFALALAPERLWDPLGPKGKDDVAAWLSRAYATEVIDSNWRFFPVLAGHGLDAIGVERDTAIADAHLKRLGEFYLGDGVYEDGPGNRVDYYNPFAFHTYGLLHYRLSGDDRFVQPAAAFARRFRSWFSADGAGVPYGRSLGYRFAQGSLWGALAAADVEAVPWAEAAGFSRRHLAWWWDRPILEPDGRLSVGYGYPNHALVEQYLTAGSPWWAMKVFTGLLAGPDHPFWTAAAAPPPGPGVEPHPPARAVHVRDADGHVTRLNGQAWRAMMRGGKDTYGRLAYSTLTGFSHSVDGPGLEAAAPDGTLVLSEDGRHWRGREDSDDGVIGADGTVTVTWRPWEDVHITSTLEASVDGWHTRTHVIDTARRLHVGEGGWCVPRDGHEADVGTDRIAVVSQGIRSELVGDDRDVRLIAPMPGTHLYWPATVLPVLTGVLGPGRHVLRARCFAGRDRNMTEAP